jgi:hypothetical protein
VTDNDKTGFALYKWDFSHSFTAATRRLSIYVPDDTDIKHVGGNPTYYYFWAQDYSQPMPPRVVVVFATVGRPLVQMS